MKIVLLTSGSRGDVQPFVALVAGMKRAGLNVSLVTHEPFRSFVEENGIDFRSMSGDPRQLLESEQGRELMESAGNSRLFIKKMAQLSEPIAVEATRDAAVATADADLLLCSTSMLLTGEALAEKHGCRLGYVSLQPIAPTVEQRGMFQRELPTWLKFLEGWGYNRFAQIVGLQVYASIYAKITDRVRREVLNLPRRSRFIRPEMFVTGPEFFYGYSEHVLPRPRDWAATQHVCGYWFLPRQESWQPSQKLVDFLGSGPAPVYVGFGSMPSEDPAAASQLVIRAAELSGQRIVVLKGWGSFSERELPEQVCMVDNVPHDWLFPQMAAVVHHGGAGTTATGLRAGVPTVIIPHIADQPFWGRRVHTLGAGPLPIPRRELTAEKLADAMRQAATSPEIKTSAARLGELLRQEDGVARAVELIDRYSRS